MKNKGFTFIELLIAISITGIILSIATSNFRDFTTRQQVDDLSRKLIADIRSIQEDAASGVKQPAACTGVLSGYQIFFNVGASSVGANTRATGYTVYSLCPTTLNVVTTVNFPTNQYVIVNRTPANARITFKPLQSGTDIPSNSSVTITAGSSQTTRTITVTVDSSGSVK